MPGSCLIIDENLPVPFDRRVWMECLALRDAGWAVSVISPVGSGAEVREELRDGVHLYRHRLPQENETVAGYAREYSAALLWELRLASRAWRRRRFDVVHICNPPDLLFLVADVFKALFGTAVIFDHHDLSPELYETKFGRRDLPYWGLRVVERLTFLSADVVISTNETYRRVAVERGHLSDDRVVVVRNGPDLGRFGAVPEDRDFRRGREHAVGYVGTMGEQEGIDGLLRSIALIVNQFERRDIHFMIIGGGPAVQSLVSLSAEMGLQEHVEFPGRVSDDELLARLSSCDVCVNPDPATPFNDASTMTKIIDYMALGKPIVQYDLTEGRRSARDASLYAPPGDETAFARMIVELLDHPELGATMGTAGRKRAVEELEWRHQKPHLLHAYELALGMARKRQRRGTGGSA